MKLTLNLLACLIFPIFAMGQNFSKIDTILKDYSGSNPGAALAIVKDGKIIFSKSFGLGNLDPQQPVTLNTNFRLASVSKQFTAVAILQLIEKNKLSLETKLNDCFPEIPDYGRNITLLQLLDHTSGILDYDDVIDETDKTKQLSDADVLKACTNFKETYFKPGTAYRYSNTAYVLLGLIVEKYSGLSFPDYLEKFIFKPLKMKTSIAYVKGTNSIKNRAFGHSKSNGQWILKDQSSTSATLGDGGIYSNINDLLKWNKALNSPKILSAETWNKVFSAQKLNDGTPIKYGLGWHLKDSPNGKAVTYHTGSTTSFRNIIYRIPEEKLTLILLTNRNTPVENNMVSIAERILTSL